MGQHILLRVCASIMKMKVLVEWLDTLSFITGVPLSDPTISSIDEDLYAMDLLFLVLFSITSQRRLIKVVEKFGIQGITVLFTTAWGEMEIFWGVN